MKSEQLTKISSYSIQQCTIIGRLVSNNTQLHVTVQQKCSFKEMKATILHSNGVVSVAFTVVETESTEQSSQLLVIICMQNDRCTRPTRKRSNFVYVECCTSYF